MRTNVLLVLLCLVAAAVPVPARAQAAPSSAPLRVFLDCDCYGDYLRSEITWVDFVRERQDADVQVISTTNPTGGGGEEVVLRFAGLGRFAGVEQETRVVSIAADPEDLKRRRMRDAVVVALMALLGREGRAGSLSLTVRDAAEAVNRQTEADPWNFWVFSVGVEGDMESEESSRDVSWQLEATADRVTDAWKVSFGARLEQQRESFIIDEDELDVVRRERRGDAFVAKSLGPHWSVGIDGKVETSTFGNVKFLAEALPTVEFNIFPYAEYASRQLRLEYSIGTQHARYNEITLYDQLRETHPLHEFSVTVDQRQRWGTLQTSVEWSQYLHDLRRNRFEVQGELSVRLARGLSVEMNGTASRIRDQLSLPRRNANPEEVLLRLRELQSGHNVELSFGITYTFGSLFNNIVNPRFGL